MDMWVGILMDLNGFVDGMVSSQWNLKGRISLEFCMDKESFVSNEWFKRGKETGHVQIGIKLDIN